MTSRYCDECSMPHDTCGRCGAAVVASLHIHRHMNAHGNGPHFCGADNPGYQAMLRAMRNDYDESREMLTECPTCRDDVIRRANSPALYDVHGYYGLQGDSALHQCVTAESAPAQEQPARTEPEQRRAPPAKLRIL